MSTLQIIRDLLQGKTPGQLIIQLTDRCNASCPQCNMRVTNEFPRSTLRFSECEKIIDRAGQRRVQALSITGGEPLLYLDQVTRLISRGAAVGIRYIRTGSNGFFLRNAGDAQFQDRIKRITAKLAATPLRNFWISIDSADPLTHEAMRGFKELMQGLEKALPIFHEFGLYPTANMGLNRNLVGRGPSILTRGLHKETEKDELIADISEGLAHFFTMVTNLGFSIVNFCFPMSAGKESGLQAVYGAGAPEHLVTFSPVEKYCLFSAMLKTIPRFRSDLRIFTPLSSLQTLQNLYAGKKILPFPCKGGRDYFYINASDGKTYPCGFRGEENLGDYSTCEFSVSQIKNCTRCDWECFRDPSELIGPMLQAATHPVTLFTRYRRNLGFYSHWLADLRYYRACDFFDGRKPARVEKLRKFSCPDPIDAQNALSATSPHLEQQL